ncbi:myo-inositol 2-dehydrogenase [Tranquillimonas rosea]|uniref:Inositol 2-dehydrogenase n=1 Tax=Tranquillimonas rosea TaxID=641238 RepID=A0A1H9XAJ5_9RHOB|nr:Gfo/Idh/MocA family oxidoreductase [Tranquillimonas rosea]SES43190.1 myo-inositol 2-dehydrogenase [Tranquillimonas rosea]
MTVKLGVIGTGMIGTDHTRRIQEVLTGAEVVALYDYLPENAAKLQAAHAPGAKIHETGEALIAADEVDAVLVCSTGSTHESYVLGAIEAGKPVFCEKPLATTAEGAKRIVDAESAAGRRLVQVGFMRRFDQGYNMLKATMESDLGTPLMIHACHRNAAVPEHYVTPMAIHDTFIHEIDTFRWLLDDDFVSAQVIFPRKTRHAHDKVADPQIVLLETSKGVRIDCEIFVNCRYGYDIQCQVVGEEGVADLPEPMAVATRREARLSQPILTDWKSRFMAAFDAELQDFADRVPSGHVGGPSAWDGYVAAISSDACVTAQETGAIVDIALPDRPALYD